MVMFMAFALMLAGKGAPTGLVVFALAQFCTVSAGLTNYGTSTAPMYFAQNYVSFRQWWTTGFAVSLVTLAIWWWHLLGIW